MNDREEEARETKEFIEFKSRWGELAKEAMKIIKKIEGLEGKSAKLMERKKAGEFVKDLLKQNKIELKRLKKREMEIYLESKKVIKNERKRTQFVRSVVTPHTVPGFNPFEPLEKKQINTLNNITIPYQS